VHVPCFHSADEIKIEPNRGASDLSLHYRP
jgi:hypothetical protein